MNAYACNWNNAKCMVCLWAYNAHVHWVKGLVSTDWCGVEMNGIMLPSDKLLSHIHNRKQTAEISLILILIANAVYSWLGGSVVERRSLTGELSMVCTGLAPDG